jgi:dolichol-phosphate mannosyltransferase
MTALGFLMTLRAVYMKFFTSEGFSGFATIIVLITIIGGVQLILLGFVGLYIGKIFEETKKRPLYIIREALGVEKIHLVG